MKHVPQKKILAVVFKTKSLQEGPGNACKLGAVPFPLRQLYCEEMLGTLPDDVSQATVRCCCWQTLSCLVRLCR